MNLLVEFDKFVDHLTNVGRLIRKSSIAETRVLYEFFSPMLLPSAASIWRLSVALVIADHDVKQVKKVHQEFLEFHQQSNVTRLVIFSDVSPSDGLKQYLDQFDIPFINLLNEVEEESSFESLYTSLEDLLYPAITSEQIEQISSPEKLSDADQVSQIRRFLCEALNKTVSNNRSALRLMPYYIAIPKRSDDGIIKNVTSLDFGGSFFASVEHDEKGSNAFIYPNRFYINNVLHDCRLLIDQLNTIQAPDHFRVVVDALLRTCSTLIHLYLNVLYGADLYRSIAGMFDSLRVLSQEDCVALLLDDFEASPPDEQIAAIDAAVQLSGVSNIVVEALLKGAQSNVKTVAVHCIRILGQFGVSEALPVLKDLKDANSKRVRDAAERALALIESDARRWESNREAISVDSLKRVIEGDLAEHEILKQCYSKASLNSFFPGPNGTVIHIQLWEFDGDSCIARTSHEDGTFDMAMGKRFGMSTRIVGILTGAIEPSPDQQIGMGEAAMFDAEGNIKRINLSDEREEK